jgi:ATP-binding cassette subfamily C protein LapB
METIRIFGADKLLKKRWFDNIMKVFNIQYKINYNQNRVQALIKVFTMITTVGIYAIGAIYVLKGEITTGALIGANILSSRALMPFIRWSQLAELFVKANRAKQLMDQLQQLPRQKVDGIVRAKFTGQVELKDLAFYYPEDKQSGKKNWIFESLNLKIEPGHIMAIIGQNGSGKSTLAKLLVGLLEPTRGQILMDGVNLQQFQLDWWQRQIIYLPQEPSFINASIRDNITLGREDVDPKYVQQVIHQAGLNEYIEQSNDGINTQIIRNGQSLSLGIRRRIALARALFIGQQASLAVFDEPNEGFDFEGRKIMGQLMKTFIQEGKSIILTSHNRQAVKMAHCILDLNQKPTPIIEYHKVNTNIITNPNLNVQNI